MKTRDEIIDALNRCVIGTGGGSTFGCRDCPYEGECINCYPIPLLEDCLSQMKADREYQKTLVDMNDELLAELKWRSWNNMKVRKPRRSDKYLVASRISKDFDYVIDIEWWDENIGESYPFKYYDEYKDRKGGGWVLTGEDDDVEDKWVEWWMELPDVPENESVT